MIKTPDDLNNEHAFYNRVVQDANKVLEVYKTYIDIGDSLDDSSPSLAATLNVEFARVSKLGLYTATTNGQVVELSLSLTGLVTVKQYAKLPDEIKDNMTESLKDLLASAKVEVGTYYDY